MSQFGIALDYRGPSNTLTIGNMVW